MGDLNNVFPLSIDRSVVRSEVKNECHIPTKSVEGRERESQSSSSPSGASGFPKVPITSKRAIQSISVENFSSNSH